MLYMEHNAAANYHSANGAGDSKMKTDILMSEISKLIVNRPERVVQIINRHRKNKIVKTPNRGQLVSTLSAGIQNSPRLAKELAMEIMGVEHKFSADSTKTATPAKTTDYAKLLGDTANIVNGLGNLFGGKKKATAATEKAKAEAEKAKAEAEKALHDKTTTIATLKGAKSYTTTYIMIGAGLALVVAGAIVYVKYFKK